MPLIHPLMTRPLGVPPPQPLGQPVTARTDRQYIVGRPVAFPLHLMVGNEVARARSQEYQPGRVLLNTCGPREGGDPSDVTWLRSDLDSYLCAQDVPWVPLYRGTMHQEGPWPPMELPSFAHNSEVIRELADQVPAILVGGNRWYETGYLHGMTSASHQHAEEASFRVCGVVEQGGAHVRSLGARPGFALIDLQILLDCYRMRDWPLRAALQQCEALTVCFLAWKLYDHMVTLKEGDIPEYILPRNLLDPWPHPRLREWTRGLECWAGMDYIEGLQRGNDQNCSEGGWTAGIIGQLPDGVT